MLPCFLQIVSEDEGMAEAVTSPRSSTAIGLLKASPGRPQSGLASCSSRPSSAASCLSERRPDLEGAIGSPRCPTRSASPTFRQCKHAVFGWLCLRYSVSDTVTDCGRPPPCGGRQRSPSVEGHVSCFGSTPTGRRNCRQARRCRSRVLRVNAFLQIARLIIMMCIRSCRCRCDAELRARG